MEWPLGLTRPIDILEKKMPGFGLANILLNQKDLGILATAVAMSARNPSEKQCIYQANLLKRLEQGVEL